MKIWPCKYIQLVCNDKGNEESWWSVHPKLLCSRYCVQWGALPNDRPAEFPLHHYSALFADLVLLQTDNHTTKDIYQIDTPFANWWWMFQWSANTVSAGKTSWLLWAQCLHDMKFSRSSKNCWSVFQKLFPFFFVVSSHEDSFFMIGNRLDTRRFLTEFDLDY